MTPTCLLCSRRLVAGEGLLEHTRVCPGVPLLTCDVAEFDAHVGGFDPIRRCFVSRAEWGTTSWLFAEPVAWEDGKVRASPELDALLKRERLLVN